MDGFQCWLRRSRFRKAWSEGGRPRNMVRLSISSRAPPGSRISRRYRVPLALDIGSAENTLSYMSAENTWEYKYPARYHPSSCQIRIYFKTMSMEVTGLTVISSLFRCWGWYVRPDKSHEKKGGGGGKNMTYIITTKIDEEEEEVSHGSHWNGVICMWKKSAYPTIWPNELWPGTRVPSESSRKISSRNSHQRWVKSYVSLLVWTNISYLNPIWKKRETLLVVIMIMKDETYDGPTSQRRSDAGWIGPSSRRD